MTDGHTWLASVRAWWHLTMLSVRRSWWSLQTFVAVLLLVLVAGLVGVASFNTYRTEGYWGWPINIFTNAIIANIYLAFLLPLLALSFGTQELGGDWEDRSLVWLLTRPLPRPAIYTSKFIAALPKTIGLTLGGLLLLGLLAGVPGWRAVLLFWPAIALGSIAYLSLFLLMGIWFRRSTVIGVVYSFVIETIVGNMPGLVKRASIGFYSRCIVFDIAKKNDLETTARGRPFIAPDKESFFLPVTGDVAIWTLIGVTLSCLLLGCIIFSRREYNDLT